MNVELLTADTSKFSDDFYCNNFKNIKHIKSFEFFDGSLHQKESILAWSIVLKRLADKLISPDISFHSYGKPYIKGEEYFFNISHSDGFVAVVFATQDIAVDVQYIDNKDHSNIYRRVLTEAEKSLVKNQHDFFKLWTLKEAYFKLLGIGISGGLNCIDFSTCLNLESFKLTDTYFHSNILNDYYISICSNSDFDVNYLNIKDELLTF